MGNIISYIYPKSNKSTLKIIITQDYKLQVKHILSKNNETFVYLPNNHQEVSYDPCILFNGNSISICQNNIQSIHFLQQWLDNPDEYTFYTVQFQNKEYKLLAEVLFALIISEFKQIIEKEYIIENTILELSTKNKKAIQRIKISLNALGLNGMEIDDNNILFDYSEQGEY